MKYVLGPVVGVAALLAWARAAEAQYTGAVTGNDVTFTGGINADTLILGTVGGFLTHNRPMSEGFVAPNDLDSATGGVQSVLVSALNSLTVNAGGGDDTVVLTALTGVPPAATIVVNGEDGNDVLTGGDAAETFSGGPGDDVIEAGGGTDSVFGGAGIDAIGLGTANGESNSVDGGSDVDTVVLLGDLNANAFSISRTGGVLTFSIDGNVSTATYGNLEAVSIEGLAGDDTFTLEPLDDLAYAVDGSADLDTLNIDAGGNLVVQNSSTVTVAGRMPITHTNVETVNVSNVGLSLGGDDGDSCGLLGLEALVSAGLAALLRRRRR